MIVGLIVSFFFSHQRVWVRIPKVPGKEIVVKGDNVMKEYYRNQAATEETLKGGWLHTGDLGYQDPDGYFFISGRKTSPVCVGDPLNPMSLSERPRSAAFHSCTGFLPAFKISLSKASLG
jgi:non-ribosomal peptide synthetase component F